MTSVLIISEDNKSFEPASYLKRNGFTVAIARNVETGVAQASSGKHDVVAIVAAQPGSNAVDIVRRIRERDVTPVLLLTAGAGEADRIAGFDAGADDCAPASWSPRELCARLRAIARRKSALSSARATGNAVMAGGLAMWPERRSAEWQGKPLPLTSTEFTLLEMFARNAGRTLSKIELSERGLSRPFKRNDRSVDMHVSRIRQKLGVMPDGRSYIQAIFRKGYQFIQD